MAGNIKLEDLRKDNLINKMREMKIDYAIKAIYANPVELTEFYNKFSALTANLESQYAKSRADKYKKYTETSQAISQDIELSGRRVTQAEIDRRTEQHLMNITASLRELEIEAKSCRNHCTAMQSSLRNYSDEAKGYK